MFTTTDLFKHKIDKLMANPVMLKINQFNEFYFFKK